MLECYIPPNSNAKPRAVAKIVGKWKFLQMLDFFYHETRLATKVSLVK